MVDDVFDGHALAEKLFKLNSSQQSIESLSRMCITHQKKAKQIVEIWDKSFKSSQMEQRVSFLYLANDILQNSRRKGNEYVNEFWKVLPAALKHVYEHTDEQGKKAASRLVDIWDERRVFGSRGQNLKDEMLGKKISVSQVSNINNGKSINPVKIVKKDAHSLRIKLAVGATPEKILTAFHLVHNEHVNEETALNNCEGAVRRIGDLERDVESICSQGNLPDPAVLDEIQEQESLLQQCVSQLESVEATRSSLVSQLKEALQDQELKLELIHSQLQVARRQGEQAMNIKKKLASSSAGATPLNHPMELQQTTSIPQAQAQAQTMMSFSATTKTREEENNVKKAAAAAVAAKLTASSSSAQMLTSVLSSLVAQEGGFGFKSSASRGFFSPQEKRQKLDDKAPMSVSASASADTTTTFTSSLAPPPPACMLPPPPPPPPPPPGFPIRTTNQFVRSSSSSSSSSSGGMVMGGTIIMPPSYAAFGSGTLPPPPPLPSSHIPIPSSQQQQQQQQQPPLNGGGGGGGYYRPPGIGFYGQSHHPPPPPVPRQ